LQVEAVRAQLDPPLGSIRCPFNRMPARRNEVEYRSSEAPTVTAEEVTSDLTKVEALVELAEKAIPDMPRYGGLARLPGRRLRSPVLVRC
jgi:hypothetical protein